MAKKLLLLLLITTFQIGCGGSSSSENGALFQGKLTQGVETSHKYFKHSEGESIEEVKICALSQCSTTNEDGEWGFVVTSDFKSGAVMFTFNGHGINTETIVAIPAVEDIADLNFKHENGTVTLGQMTIDGEVAEVEQEEHDHSSHQH